MSSLLKQQRDFKASMASMSKNINKRTMPVSGGVASTFSSSLNPSRVRTPEPVDRKSVVYSQPADTGKGEKIQTQVLYARDYLKEKGTAMTLDDILSYLSRSESAKPFKDAMAMILRRHPQVEYDATGFKGRGSYKFRPKHAIRNGTDLVAVLQSYSTFKGLAVKELKEGWPDAEAGISELEKEHRVLVIRNKKDNTARHVWYDDPTIFNRVDSEVKDLAKNIRIPDEQTLLDTLVKEGQQPTGQVNKKAKMGPSKVEKKNKKPRRGGKTTNKHMAGVLKDFSHLRR